jgi:hypothetical protein
MIDKFQDFYRNILTGDIEKRKLKGQKEKKKKFIIY